MTEKLDIRWLKVTDSTNNRALEGIPTEKDRTTWAAEFQTAGRGQRGNTWKSAQAQNLMFSILLKPDFILAKDQFVISAIVTLGLEKYLKDKGVTSKIKWPNDIYVCDRKICGILIEHGISGEYLSTSVCGIGLNINQREFPKDLPNPTSLVLELGTDKNYELKKELETLLSDIFGFYDMAREEYLKTGKYESIYKEYLNRLYRKGEWHHYTETATGKTVEAKITGIDNTACLILEYRDRQCKSFAFKEISYII
ncbi:MAG: biotin--[Bacteroidales bacterium]|nr:biotin--[acetyl-CoA-carboxylase] ligase [Bacteroidales bacterium]